ncbi:MAG TPA: methylmalonyl-CoA mutase family protein [Acidimicrobiia bacterium]|jgi:methylmalonyl-CoA mutase|nr:methylmalonyl-CoA mutase family protein [Acidimicrobiia bacterium]
MSELQLANKVRFVTATTLFDGHDASINIFRRILQASGAEVIHLGHNRSGHEIVDAAIQEDAHAIAVTSYQGGHMEFFRYLRDMLVERDAAHIRIFGGGGGTILPEEAAELAAYGVSRIYSPDDGRSLGLTGMVEDMLTRSDFPRGELDESLDLAELERSNVSMIAGLISAAENFTDKYAEVWEEIEARALQAMAPVVGVTGTGGSGKSSLVDEVLRRLLADFEDAHVAIISVDPSKRRSGGALLGDRIRMNSLPHPRAYMRSLATRQANLALSPHVQHAVNIVKAAGFDLVILETSGIGQSDTEIVDYSDHSVYVMTPEYGAATQLEKIDMLDYADLVAINKADKRGADDALRDVRKQWKRNRLAFDTPDTDLPIHLTVASDFNDPGTNRLYRAFVSRLGWESDLDLPIEDSRKQHVVPPSRERYLAEIVEEIRRYDQWVAEQSEAAEKLYRLEGAREAGVPEEAIDGAREAVDPENLRRLEHWDGMLAEYSGQELVYHVRGQEIKVPLHTETLSHTRVPKVALPRYRSWGDRLTWLLQENLPGEFPYTAGVFPFKRTTEDPTRMFAGEGPPEQTNARFHYLSEGMPARRLSTAFDSVTLYGSDPHERPDIYGKVGNSGVSIATVDDAKKLYSGFDLDDPATSVSMTINGPAPMILAFFLNAAIDQACETYITEHDMWDEVEAKIDAIYGDRPRPRYEGDLPSGNNGLGLRLLGVSGDQVLSAQVYEELKAKTMSTVRGTVQADILKEDQAQNTCIFSTEFALKMQGDIQQYFVDNDVRNFYSVSISGYHMAEAGANPITQLAFTLANGFTFVENYLARGMHIDDFAPNLSFFFSNGIDAEYAVIGRVARRIWAKAIKHEYGGNERSQKLKYHVQTSGRSLHAQEISFNDIRTTLQALYALYDNANSLHTNAYDEAITTPTEESVRRALAIQLIINKELGLAKNENPLQGSFIISELTDLVEEAVLAEFERLNSRGGVLGAMERQYQRTKIQEESLYYEQKKESGEYPIVGVNTFLSKEGSPFQVPGELRRSTDAAKDRQIANLREFQERNAEVAERSLAELQRVAVQGGNIFEQLMETAKVASLGQMTHALYAVGGQYRRNM